MNVIDAIRKFYPEIEGGFVYWATNKDGSEWNNPIDGLIWENTMFPKPTWEEIESCSMGIEIDKKKEVLTKQRLSYLQDTDFRALRFVDEGIEYPDEIKQKRILAREEINLIESSNTIEGLNNFSDPF